LKGAKGSFATRKALANVPAMKAISVAPDRAPSARAARSHAMLSAKRTGATSSSLSRSDSTVTDEA